MKTLTPYLLFAAFVVFASCSKNKNDDYTVPLPSPVEKFSSIQDFYNRNGVQLQTFTLDATTGGNFTTPQGTKVTVPANAFKTQSGNSVTGTVTIEFKDVYKKSDMLLTQLSCMANSGIALKSGGMFFIKALQNNKAVVLAPNTFIKVEQPFIAVGDTPDNAMRPFVLDDSSGLWAPDNSDSLKLSISNYIFSLYQFSSPADSGTWCNSDNSIYFSGYSQTTLKMIPTNNADTFQTDVFLVFKNVNSMIHVYRSYIPPITFPYDYAPVGLQCTVVAIGVKDSALYSSFTPITITSNQSLYFTLSKTTADDFKTQLKNLD